jgi:hypothetical protein
MSQTSGESNDSQNAFDTLINTQKEDIDNKDLIKKLIPILNLVSCKVRLGAELLSK